MLREHAQLDPATTADDHVGGAIVVVSPDGPEQCGEGVAAADLGDRFGPGTFQDDSLVPAVRSRSEERVVTTEDAPGLELGKGEFAVGHRGGNGPGRAA